MKQAGIYVSVAVVVLAVAAGVLLSPPSATTNRPLSTLATPSTAAANPSPSTTTPNAPGSTRASSGVTCPPSNTDDCTVTATTPGGGGSGGPSHRGGGGDITCYDWNHHVVACFNPDLGWNNPADHCFYRVADPLPPASDPVWQGHRPPDGTIYAVYCRPGNGGQRQQWLPAPPPGFGGRVPQFDLAATAINSMGLRGPTIRSAPTPDGAGLVGLPVWLWTPSTASTWGPNTKSASVPGLTVTATAQADSITWSMGDGHRVTCRSVGTPYTAAAGGAHSPTCGYVYLTPSRDRPDGRFHIRATTTWHVTWSGGGLSGELDIQKYADSTVQINELEVITS
ncbi:MAG TPA: hypothetical protein VFR11_15815 [Micromonosporaceae bacterium]|nr:hypothetical protein [Micromonosporaceae bacterium]